MALGKNIFRLPLIRDFKAVKISINLLLMQSAKVHSKLIEEPNHFCTFPGDSGHALRY